MPEIDVTNTLASATAQSVQHAAPTDESLNAGALLPDEPAPDVLTNEVSADAQVVMEMLPKLNEEPALATESNFNSLRYLRQDVVKQRGMNQALATEAMAVLPNFNQGLPVNYYSRHTSPTGYKAALEEIDTSMQNDLQSQLAVLIIALEKAGANPGNGHVVENLDFTRRMAQLTMQSDLFKEFMALACTNGFQWDDATYRGIVVDPSQNPSGVPDILRIEKKFVRSFATMDEYYQAHLDAPAMMELMTTHLVQWQRTFAQFLEGLQEDAGKLTMEVPKAPTVYFNFGSKTTALANIADVFKSAADKIPPEADDYTTTEWLALVSNAAQQARVEDILIRAKSYVKITQEIIGTLKQIGEELGRGPSPDLVEQLFDHLLTFAKTLQGVNAAFGEMVQWCVHAGIATSYVGMLGNRVIDVAWKAIHGCRETMQMRESVFLQLKTMKEDIQAPVKTNTV